MHSSIASFFQRIQKFKKEHPSPPISTNLRGTELLSLDHYQNIKIVKAISSNLFLSNTITELTVCGINLSLTSAKQLNNGLLGASSLQKLRINFCLYKKELLQALIPALTSPALCPIFELDLAANAMNDEDAGELLSKIVILHSESRDETYWKYGLRDELPPYEAVVGIKKLDLSYNKLGKKTLLGIGTALKTDRYLLSLNLRSNLITAE